MPSWDLFEHQPPEYWDSVLPPEVTARVAVEQASTLGWDRYVGAKGKVVGMHIFGASAPLKELQKKFGFEPERVSVAKEVLRGRQCRDRIWNAKRGRRDALLETDQDLRRKFRGPITPGGHREGSMGHRESCAGDPRGEPGARGRGDMIGGSQSVGPCLFPAGYRASGLLL